MVAARIPLPWLEPSGHFHGDLGGCAYVSGSRDGGRGGARVGYRVGYMVYCMAPCMAPCMDPVCLCMALVWPLYGPVLTSVTDMSWNTDMTRETVRSMGHILHVTDLAGYDCFATKRLVRAYSKGLLHQFVP